VLEAADDIIESAFRKGSVASLTELELRFVLHTKVQFALGGGDGVAHSGKCLCCCGSARSHTRPPTVGVR
jgi:hypothetical protein